MRAKNISLKKMKRHGSLFEQIASIENLRLAYRNARRGKSWQKTVLEFDECHEERLIEIQKLLIESKYQTSEYRTKQIFEPKQRVIYVLPFSPDRIVQHAIIQVLEPIWDRSLLQQSFACRKNLGLHRASAYTKKCVKKYKYCLQMDIRKFYPSIDHEILFEIVCRKIKCKRTLEILREIIRSTDGCPIGNYTSQWFGNLYLDRLDQHLKHKYRVKGYCRYVDDFLIFGDSKDWLQFVRINVVEFLRKELKLEISRWQLKPVKEGVDFVGYRHFPSKILLRKSTARQMTKKITHLQGIWPDCSSIRFRSVLASYSGWAGWAQTYNLRQKLQLTCLQEMIGMRGIPKTLNTKFDYEFCRNNNISGWQKQYEWLLENRMQWMDSGKLAEGETGMEDETHKIHVQTDQDGNEERVQLVYQEDPNCKMFKLGFTVAEVESALEAS